MPALSQPPSGYDRFLFAPLFEQNGVPVSLLSLLTRLDLDPWQEAARLAGLSRREAANSLAATICNVVSEKLSVEEATTLAAARIELLPSSRLVVASSTVTTQNGGWIQWIVYAVFWVSILVSTLNVQRSKQQDLALNTRDITVAEQMAAPTDAVANSSHQTQARPRSSPSLQGK